MIRQPSHYPQGLFFKELPIILLNQENTKGTVNDPNRENTTDRLGQTLTSHGGRRTVLTRSCHTPQPKGKDDVPTT